MGTEMGARAGAGCARVDAAAGFVGFVGGVVVTFTDMDMEGGVAVAVVIPAAMGGAMLAAIGGVIVAAMGGAMGGVVDLGPATGGATGSAGNGTVGCGRSSGMLDWREGVRALVWRLDSEAMDCVGVEEVNVGAATAATVLLFSASAGCMLKGAVTGGFAFAAAPVGGVLLTEA